MDPMLEVARKFLAIEISFERNALEQINEEIKNEIEQIDKKRIEAKKFQDKLLSAIWEMRDVRAEEILANVLYINPEIAHKLCLLKPELCPDFVHYLTDEARRGWHEENSRIGWPPKREIHDLLKKHYDVSEKFPDQFELSLIRNPKFMLELADCLKAALPFSLALYKELEEIRRSRAYRLQEDHDAKAARALEDVQQTYSILERLPADDPRRREYDKLSEEGINRLNKEIQEREKDEKERLEIAQRRREPAGNMNAHSRENPKGEETQKNVPGSFPPAQAEQESLFGMALSGGGIRSATFNLGVLQGLADLDLLRRLDYLSGVSGGSYIAGWLAAWIKREEDGVRRVQRWLSRSRNPRPEMRKTQPIQFLRRFSNYLTPKKGFLSADSWVMFTTWLGNTFLNQIVFALLLASLLGVPKLVFRAFAHPAHGESAVWIGGLSIVLLGMLASLIGMNLGRFDYEPRAGRGDRRRPSRLWEEFGVQTTIIIGFLVLALLGSYQLFWLAAHPPPKNPPWLLTYFVLFLGLLTSQVCARTWRCFYTQRAEDTTARQTMTAFLFTAASSAVASFLGWGVLYLSFRYIVSKRSEPVIILLGRSSQKPEAVVDNIQNWLNVQNGLIVHAAYNRYLTATLVIGPAILLTILALMILLQLGLMGHNLPDSRREWWSRMGATMLFTTGVWVAFSACALYGPWAVLLLSKSPHWHSVIPWSAIVWLATTFIGYHWGKNIQTPALPSASPQPARGFEWSSLIPRAWIAKFAPYVYIAGLAMLLSFALYAVTSRVMHSPIEGPPAYWQNLTISFGQPWLPFAMFALALVLAWRFDINEFSMHNLYRNRLVRCYLGASRADDGRQPNPYTGFDPHDDLALSSLRVKPPDPTDLAQGALPYFGPFPIINTTLNLVAGKELAWQERKAASFVFTPLHCGYEREHATERPMRYFANYSYRPTIEYQRPSSQGPSLGTCIAVSGAAVNPNMGYHSSPALSFLMALFDARLGVWLGNTRHRNTWKQSSPTAGLLYLISEFIGRTDDTSRFINLSDGGHFENLGLYELVRRRCKYIIASDAEEDANFSFNGLGNAIRRCRTDFGVDIRINPDHLRPVPAPEQARSRVHCAVGDIVYSPESRGKLLYIKTSLTGDEPGDVLEYKNREADFPHQTTVDQFFDESQFESYRALGQHIAIVALTGAVKSAPEHPSVRGVRALIHDLSEKLLGPREHTERELAAADADANASFLRELFRYLQATWYPQMREMPALQMQHSEMYDDLVEKIGAGRDAELSHVTRTFFQTKPGWQPQHDFFVYCKMIELMHHVFQDLELETTTENPLQEGWISIFRGWAKDDNFRHAWSVIQGHYDIQFRNFCKRELHLDVNATEPPILKLLHRA